MTTRRRQWPPWLIPVLIFAVALGLRLLNLGYHSLWFDEAMSAFWAARPASEIWRVGLALTEDKHPPLYYLMLHGWTALFGASDAAVRALGVLLGALAVFPTYGIGLRLGDRRAAAIGALLLALNPFLIWYSQEARMFMPATTFVLFGLYGLLRLAEEAACPDPGARVRGSGTVVLSVLLIVVGFSAALYTYLFSAFMLPVAFIWLILLGWQARRCGSAVRILAPGMAALGLTVLLFLPLARAAWQVSGAEATGGRAFAGMAGAVWQLLGVYAVGWPGWPAAVMGLLTAGAAMLTLAGLFLPRNRAGHVPGGVLLAIWLGVPLLAGGLLLARDRTVFAESRYFIFLAPALCLAWGRALAWLWGERRVAGLAGLALALGITVAALPALWSPENRREAWREAAMFVAAHAGPGDAVLVQPDYVHPAFTRYFRGPQPLFLPFSGELSDPAQVEGPLAGLAGYDAVWLVQSHHQEFDPGDLVNGWFAERDPLITEVFPPGIAVRGYLQHYRLDAPPPGIGPAGEPTGDGPQMLGCLVTPDRLRATDDLLHPPSNWLYVTTYWGRGASPGSDEAPQVQMVDGGGQVWGQSLERAGNTFQRWPPSKWQPGEVARMDHEVNLNPATPAGRYSVIVSLPAGTARYDCGEVEIVR